MGTSSLKLPNSSGGFRDLNRVVHTLKIIDFFFYILIQKLNNLKKNSGASAKVKTLVGKDFAFFKFKRC